MNDTSIYPEQIDQLLNLPQQIWLLGAGVSKDAGVPLMNDLTDRVEVMLKHEDQDNFKIIRSELSENAHVEHVLSQISDMISLASRTSSNAINLLEKPIDLEELRNLHSEIQLAIQTTTRYGYKPAENDNDEQIGELGNPIVSLNNHLAFIDALFRHRRAGFERRPPVSFFTTNYDTLLEDALALGRIPTSDGFSGGTMAFWDPTKIFDIPLTVEGRYQAIIHKLHGSIDWFTSPEDVVVREREGAGYPPEASERLLIYPQATKYQITQKDPFATLFRAFRSSLMECDSGLFAVCGYSFRDDHINEEVELAMRQRNNSITLLAFIKQVDEEVDGSTQGLPEIFSEWLGNTSNLWRERIIVAGSRGVYHGSLENISPVAPHSPHQWWSFHGLTNLLKHGMEYIR